MALVQTQTATGSATTLGLTWTGNTTTGNTILVFASTSFAAFATVSSITDSQSNTYTKVDSISSGVGNDDVECWIAQNIAGGSTPTVTVTFSGSGQQEGVIIREYNGVLSASLDVHTLAAQTGSSNVITGPTTATTTQANEFVIAYATFSTAQTVTAGSGYANVTSIAAVNGQMAVEDKAVSVTGTQQAVFNVSSGNAVNIGFGMVTLKQGAIVIPPTPMQVTRIPNKFVGPMAQRHNFQPPKVIRTASPPTVQTQRTQTGVARIAGTTQRNITGVARIITNTPISQIETFQEVLTQDYQFPGSTSGATTYGEINHIAFPRYYEHRYNWNPAAWDGVSAIYFESMLGVDTAAGTVYAQLWNVTDNVAIVGSEVTWSDTYPLTPQRSGDLSAAMPSSPKQLAVYTKLSNTSMQGYVASGRIVVQQNSSATKFEQAFELNQASHVNGTTTPFVDNGVSQWKYEAARFDGIQQVLFEVSAAVQGTVTGTYDLWDLTSSSAVTTLTTTSTTNVVLTSPDIKSLLVDGHEYGVRLTASGSGGTQSVSQGGARIRISQTRATKTQMSLTGIIAGLFAATNNDGAQLDPGAFNSSYGHDMYAEIVYVNNSTSGTGTGYAKDGTGTTIPNTAITTTAGDTNMHRVRNSTPMTWPSSSTFYRPYDDTVVSPGTVVNVWRAVMNIYAQTLSSRTISGVARIAGVTGRTITGVSRVAGTTKKTITGVARIVAPLSPGVIFHDAGNSSSSFDTTGSNTTYGGNNGMFGSLGASGSMHVNFSGSAYVFEGAQKNLGQNATIFQWWYRPASTATLGSGNSIFTAFTDGTYNTGTAPIRVDIATVDSTHYNLALVDPSNSYAYTSGTTSLLLGVPVRIVVAQTATGWNLYINNNTTPEISYSRTQASPGIQYVVWGTIYENPSGSYTGVADFDEFWASNMYATPSTTAGKILDAYRGYLQNHVSAEGQPYRGVVDGNNLSGTAAINTVSENVPYVEKLSVQQNDQASFILVDNWVLANLLRSKSTTTNTQNNAAPTTFLNLMCFSYNSANTDGKGIGTIYDANFATDADIERAQALLWAHARWGSSSNAVGSDLVAPNYLQRALNILGDLRGAFTSYSGNQYLWNDAYQSGTTIQMGGDYEAPAAFKLFAQYDTSNIAFWNAAVAGAYDAHNKAANVIFSGATPAQSSTSKLNPDWFAFNTSTGAVSTTPSTYGDSDYGYNALRIYPRLYDAYVWYGDTNALTVLQQPKSFFTSEYSSNSKIRATFKHDGTNTGNYENTLFTYPAYWSLYANDNSNTTASALLSNKLSNLYYQAPYGSIISNAPSSAQYGYFDQSWNLIYAMQQAGTYTNYGQLTTTTTQKTITGVARITAVTTRTITGVSRVTNTTQRAQTGKARITVVTQRTQTGVSRIQLVTARTQTGVARIQVTTTRNITGVSRVQVTTVRTITGVSRITAKTTRTQTGVARIIATTQRTITGVSRVTVTTLRTINGVSRIQIVSSRTQTGLSRVLVVQPRTISGQARITAQTARTQAGRARITATTLQTILGKANLVAKTLRTISGVSKITAATNQTISGKANILATTSRTISGVARIQLVTQRTQPGVSRITIVTARTISGVSRITATTSRTINGVARITATTLRTIAGKANIVAKATKTITGVSRITVTTPRTITGVSRVTATTQKTITGVSRIQIVTQRTQTGVARITIVTTRAITGVARVTATTLRTITGVSRITATTQRAQTGKSRIQIVTLRTITGISRIAGTTLRTISGKANIAGTTQRNQSGTARITFAANRNQPGVARITATTQKTITGVSRIQLITQKTITGVTRVTQKTLRTISGVSRITLITQRTQTGVSRIQATAVKTITGKANIRNNTLRTITGVASITLLVTTQKNISGVANIKNTTQRTQTGKARITVTTPKTITGVSRITVSTTKNITGVSRIIVTTSRTITGVSRITAKSSQSITGISRITQVTLRNITGKSNLVSKSVQTIFGKAAIRITTTRTITGRANIGSTTVKIITGTARIVFGIDVFPAPSPMVVKDYPTMQRAGENKPNVQTDLPKPSMVINVDKPIMKG